MSRVIFTYNSSTYIINCQKDDLMLKICKRFSLEIDVELNKLYFLYNGTIINYLLTYNDQANNEDKEGGTMNVLAYLDEDENGNNENKNMIISKDIICPKCRDICLLKIKNYKISFYNCKKNEKLDKISLDEYENLQKIDQSEIVCDYCKSSKKSDKNNNKLFICLSCDKNICFLCKSEHNQTHDIIDYELKNYICKIHNENFHSYCNNCDMNLCVMCESEHEHRENIVYFGDIIPKKDIIKNQINELQTNIAKYNEKKEEILKNIRKILNKITNNMEVYFNINNNIFKDYERKKRNYYLLNNLNEIINNNNKIIKDLNEITNENNILNLFTNVIKIYNKMNREDYEDDDDDSDNYNDDNNKKNEIIARYEINEDSKKIKIFGNEFIKNNKNNFEFFVNGEHEKYVLWS